MADDAEAIAKVVADIRKGTVRNALGTKGQGPMLHDLALRFSQMGPVVDATPIYQPMADDPEPMVNLYDDYQCLAPPWDFGSICYRNQHGNVIVMACMATDWFNLPNEGDDATPDEMNRASWKLATEAMERLVGGKSDDLWDGNPDDGPIDWDNIRWTIDTFLWTGGRGGSGPMPTVGPIHMWRTAVRPDGTPADHHWVSLTAYPMENWDMAHITLLGALNFCNATNTEIVEPTRPRAEAKRIARTGVRVSMIHVRPMGRSANGARRLEPLDLTAQHGVRGHMAHYGACCPGHDPKGLLFGKLTGRYWVPPHVRGDAKHGTVVQNYRLEPTP